MPAITRLGKSTKRASSMARAEAAMSVDIPLVCYVAAMLAPSGSRQSGQSHGQRDMLPGLGRRRSVVDVVGGRREGKAHTDTAKKSAGPRRPFV